MKLHMKSIMSSNCVPAKKLPKLISSEASARSKRLKPTIFSSFLVLIFGRLAKSVCVRCCVRPSLLQLMLDKTFVCPSFENAFSRQTGFYGNNRWLPAFADCSQLHTTSRSCYFGHHKPIIFEGSNVFLEYSNGGESFLGIDFRVFSFTFSKDAPCIYRAGEHEGAEGACRAC